MSTRLLPNVFRETARCWPRMNFYDRFEQIVAIVLSIVISVIVVVALLELIGKVGRMVIAGALDPLDHEVFQNVFGSIMTLLIAMEFKHSIIRVIERRESIVQVKIVVLIAILALARKFIVLDTAVTEPSLLAALGAVMLALGVVYWLIRDHQAPRGRAGAEHPKLGSVPDSGSSRIASAEDAATTQRRRVHG